MNKMGNNRNLMSGNKKVFIFDTARNTHSGSCIASQGRSSGVRSNLVPRTVPTRGSNRVVK